MAYFTVLALVLFAGVCHGGQRIIGGNPTTIERYPYIVQVDFWNTRTSTWSQSCAANVLNQVYVLSAAHCFEARFLQPYHPSFRRIRAGSTYRNRGGQVVNIVREFNHPDFRVNRMSNDADISVIRLDGFISFSPVYQQVRLVSLNSQVADDTPVVHVGWGHTLQGVPGSSSPVLLKTQIYTINNDVCRNRYEAFDKGIVTSNMICAGLLDIGGRDACQGDSGGPLYYDDTNILVGVVSWGHGCANETFPGISAAVSPYVNWIQSIVDEN